jgi:hypothetical protein
VVTRGKTEIMRVFQIQTMRLVQAEELFVKNLNAGNSYKIPDICIYKC